MNWLGQKDKWRWLNKNKYKDFEIKKSNEGEYYATSKKSSKGFIGSEEEIKEKIDKHIKHRDNAIESPLSKKLFKAKRKENKEEG